MTNQYIDGHEAMRRMDEWGAQKKPFLFLIDFEGTECLVLSLDEIDPEELGYDFRGMTNWRAVSYTHLTLPTTHIV